MISSKAEGGIKVESSEVIYSKHRMEEEWRTVKEDSRYEVSSEGRIRRNYKKAPTRILTPCSNDRGYAIVNLMAVGSRQLHRLVAEAFLENPENLPVIDHINRDKSDNRVLNLRWASYTTNSLNKEPPATNTGEHHISMTQSFRVRMYGKPHKSFRTLEEAIKYRES